MDKETDKTKSAEKVETFTKEDVEKLITEAVTAKETELKAHISKLNEENKNRRLSEKELKETFAEALGLNKEEKTDNDLLKEKFSQMQAKTKELEDKWQKAETEKAKILKHSQVKDIAGKQGFADPNDVLAFVNADSESLEDDIKKLAELKPYLLKSKPDLGAGSKANANENQLSLREELNVLLKKSDLTGQEKQRMNEISYKLKTENK